MSKTRGPFSLFSDKFFNINIILNGFNACHSSQRSTRCIYGIVWFVIEYSVKVHWCMTHMIKLELCATLQTLNLAKTPGQKRSLWPKALGGCQVSGNPDGDSLWHCKSLQEIKASKVRILDIWLSVGIQICYHAFEVKKRGLCEIDIRTEKMEQTSHPATWYSISLIIPTTARSALESRLSPSSVIIFQPFLPFTCVMRVCVTLFSSHICATLNICCLSTSSPGPESSFDAEGNLGRCHSWSRLGTTLPDLSWKLLA